MLSPKIAGSLTSALANNEKARRIKTKALILIIDLFIGCVFNDYDEKTKKHLKILTDTINVLKNVLKYVF